MPWCASDTSPGRGPWPPGQPHIGDRVVRGAKRPRGDQGGVGAGEASDALDARDSVALARVIAVRMVVKRCASIKVPIPS
jgi:hypothetical protein